jgi:hypothetical protein
MGAGEPQPIDVFRFERDLDSGDVSVDDEWWRTLGDTRPAAGCVESQDLRDRSVSGRDTFWLAGW